ncbi:MAG: hypothetical protein SFW67_03555 [Myxococcaceae bacterium]|nr:hypothetical protein [Myxococcaceae bacterium]
MTTRRLGVLVALAVFAVTGLGCKRARFKSRGLSAPSAGSARFARSTSRALGGFDDDGFSSGSRATFDRALEQRLDELALERQRAQLDRELKTALESAVERHCLTISADLLYLEPQGDALRRLFRSLRQASAPADVTLPAASTVMGLPVHVMRFGKDPQWCADQDEALVARLVRRSEAPVASDVKSLALGAWLVRTAPGRSTPASASLVSRSFLESLGVKGDLVAFAPTDHAVAYANASNPKAIAAAAKAVTAALDAEGNDGLLQAQPLVWSGGVWRAWTPKAAAPEVKAAIAHALELETSVAGDIVKQLTELKLAALVSPGLHAPALDLDADAFTPAPRSRRADGQMSVQVESDALDSQLVGVAPMVEVVDVQGRSEWVPWSTFEAKAKRHLSPVTVDGVVVPRVYELRQDFAWKTRVD